LERRLAAILAADVVGYTRLMGADETGTLRRLSELRQQVLEPLIVEHHGRIVKLMGDGLLVEFASVVNALTCAVAWQNGVAQREAAADEDKRFKFRIGINLGDVIVEGDDIHGDGVNIAARLEGQAEPGGICLSGDAYRQAKGKVEADFEDLGDHDLKNVAEPVRVYRIAGDRSSTGVVSPAREPLALADKPSIAVLPFENMSGDPEQEYLVDGITEDIITELSRFRDLFVIARNSSFSYKGKSVKVQNIGRDLSVAYVVEGSVRKSGNRLRVNAQLIEAATGKHMWAERYDRELQDIFTVQDEIAQIISAVIIPEIGQAEQKRARRRPPQNLSAWEYYQRGLWHMYRFTRDDLIEARGLFESTIQRDPEFAAAYSGLAYALLQEVMYSEPENPNELLRVALDAARRGVELDTHDSFARFVLGRVHVMHHELEIACAEFETAIDLNPSFAYPYFGLGIALLDLSRFEQAHEKFKIAQRLSPRDPHAWAFIHYQAWPLLGLKRYEEVIGLERRALRNPNAGFWPYIPLLAALGQLGRKDEAKKELEKLQELQPAYSCTKARRHLVDAVNPIIDQVIDGLRKAGLPE
jgi:adenylate cyclase